MKGSVAKAETSNGTILIHHGGKAHGGLAGTQTVIPAADLADVQYIPPTKKDYGLIRFATHTHTPAANPWEDSHVLMLDPQNTDKANTQVAELQQQILAAKQYQAPADPASTVSLLDAPLVAKTKNPAEDILGSFNGYRLLKSKIHKGLKTWPVAGATATVETGAELQQRVTLTRLTVGVATLGAAGLFAGGAWKKQKGNKVFLTIEFPTGDPIIEQLPPKKEKAARTFASRINQASQLSTQHETQT